MGPVYPYYTRWDKYIMEIICIYGARAIFYYFMITETLNVSKAK